MRKIKFLATVIWDWVKEDWKYLLIIFWLSASLGMVGIRVHMWQFWFVYLPTMALVTFLKYK